jgi:hypothetical protein
MKFLLSFFVCSISFLCISDAQILYTDINPDANLNVFYGETESVYLDINQDSIDDFVIYVYSWYSGSYGPTAIYAKREQIYALDTNSRVGVTDTLIVGPGCDNIAIDSGKIILENNFYWKRNPTIYYYDAYAFSGGCSSPSEKKFIALKLFVNGNYYLGWIQFKKEIIYDMAINLNAGKPIMAGSLIEPPEPPEEPLVEVPNLEVYPTFTVDKLEIVGTPNEIEKYSLYNTSGKLMKSFYLNLSGRSTFDISDLMGGIYILINHKSGKATKIMKMERQEK